MYSIPLYSTNSNIIEANYRHFSLKVLICLPKISEIEIMKPSPDHGRMYPEGTVWSAIGEWLIVVLFMFFVATFIPVFKKTKLTLIVDYQK